ncbi:CATRA conflict system CASPASE/TPR repeat-associated protein [Pseudofrankia saprophytica]|uniref:CATRA conflict system CASPASE/TPR repeat-associated protein n=1 Tax=Pseudofrankia saprophytica TaxID=298655 RepID=UPI001E60A637|nr:CATRA conflict system CASPASE/TPR repeat-associated protein [Pseudofrankia saprophytica]
MTSSPRPTAQEMPPEDARPVDPALVVYLFAPLGGPGAQTAYEYLRVVWEACRSKLHMDRPIKKLSAGSTLPGSLTGLETVTGLPPTGSVLAAQAGRDPEAGRGEALLRLHHEMISLAVRLGPPVQEHDWRYLDARWATVGGPPPPAVDDALLGRAYVYLGHTGILDGPAAVARRLLPSLPAVASDDWADRGAATRSGHVVWEFADFPDARVTRQIVAVAARGRDTALSAWLWSRGTADMTPFGYYLLQTAKIRYLARLWDDGRRVRATRIALDATIVELSRLLAELAEPSVDGNRLDDRRARARDLRLRSQAAVAALAVQSAEIGLLVHAVDIAASNAREALNAEAPIEPSVGLFGDDAALSALFSCRLADERQYAERSAATAREVEGLAAVALGPLAATPDTPSTTPAPREPRRLTDEDRDALVSALAQVFHQPDAALQVLEDAGLSPALQALTGVLGALTAWRKNVTELENGLVRDPHGQLVRAALVRYPHNGMFRTAARRLGIPIVD